MKWITLLEGDSVRISQVLVAFKEIECIFKEHVSGLPILKTEETECFNNLENRKAMAVKPLHLLANLLDPVYTGEMLSNEEHVKAMECLNKILENHPKFKGDKNMIFSDVTNYCSKSEFWGLDFVWCSVKNVDSVSWWQGICKKNYIKRSSSGHFKFATFIRGNRT